MIDRDLESTLRRVEIKRLYRSECEELDGNETAGLAQRFLDEYAAHHDLRYLNVAIKLIDRLEATSGSADLVDALRSQEAGFLDALSKKWGGA